MTGQNGSGLSSSVVETLAGFTAGIATTLSLHPLDLLKTRLQVDRSSSSRLGSSIRIIRQITKNEGGITAFYRGLGPNLVGNSTSWALYFLCYASLKDVLAVYRSSAALASASTPSGSGPGSALTSSDYFLASGTAGAITSILTNPIWVIKTRMLSTGSSAPGAYTSLAAGVKQIYTTEGLRGFYRGLIPSLFGVSHGALQFMAYERLKIWRSGSENWNETNGNRNGNASGGLRKLGNLDFFVISSLSKVFAGSVTYPYQVVRSRLQTYEAHLLYRGTTDAVVKIWRKEGLRGFYKGLGPNLFRVLPSTWVTFLVYENMKIVLS